MAGGAIAEASGNRTVFIISIAIGVIVLALTAWLLPESLPAEERKEMCWESLNPIAR